MFLCDKCKAIRPLLLRNHYGSVKESENFTPHHESCLDVKAAARQGCYVCAVLWRGLIAAVGPLEMLNMHPATFCVGTTPASGKEEVLQGATFTFYCYVQNGHQTIPTDLGTFQCLPHSAIEQIFQRPDPPPNTSSAETLQLAKMWLKRCRSSHERCNGEDQQWSPTRLLDLHGDGCQIKLVFSEECPGPLQYATLSHCWGSIPIRRLLKDNVEKLRMGISMEALPKTFKDAITVARSLEIRYLWIDSLCIIQDSADDWGDESTTMGRVYRHACLNLAATGASDGSEGCFFDREVEDIWPLPESPAFRESDAENGSLQAPSQKYYFIDMKFWEKLGRHSLLFKRAWIFQERLLAKRVLHLGRKQLFWECRTDNFCETFPLGLPLALKNPFSFFHKIAYDRFLAGGDLFHSVQTGRFTHVVGRSLPDKLEHLWHCLVTEYTVCRLTRASDKLVALSGIAEDIHHLHRSVSPQPVAYVAGLWDCHLPYTLLWQALNDGKRTKEYLAPSWSWASVDRRVGWDSSRWRSSVAQAADVKSVRVDYAGSHFGQVIGGSLQVHGPFLKLDLVQYTAQEAWVYPSQKSNEAYPLEDDTQELSSALLLLLDEDAFLQAYERENLYGLQLVQYHTKSSHAPCALALIPDTRGGDIYKRVGVIRSGTGMVNGAWAEQMIFTTITIV